MSLNKYLTKKKVVLKEGFSSENPHQIKDLKKIILKYNLVDIMEIGFNAGHSSEIFLGLNKKIKVTSFDLGKHPYVSLGKKYINKTFSGRHQLIIGNSKKTVRGFYEKNRHQKFDLIFIDGGHDYKYAKADLHNCFFLSHKNTIVVMDDTIFSKISKGWVTPVNVGPMLAWLEGMSTGLISGISHRDYRPGRGMSWGRYNHEK